MPLTWSKEVYSGRATTVAYDAEAQELYVTWAKGGRTSIYGPGVPAELADQLAYAGSVGSMLNTDIIPYFAHRYA